MADLQAILEEFKAFDKTGDGQISRAEFHALLQTLDKGAWPSQDVDALLDASDIGKGTQKLPYVEFLNWLFNAGSDDTFNNIMILSDSYKVTHHLQYPAGTEKVYSYFECRGGQFPEVCFFGLQYYLKKYLTGPVVTMDKIDAAEEYFKLHFSHPKYGYDTKLFNRAGWEHIVKEHSGYLPVSIKAVPEGTVLPYKNVLFTMENTDPKCFWLTNYLETLLVQVWYPTTVCTQSRDMKKIITKYLKETGSEDTIAQGGHLFKLHDFGFRGVSSVESAATGGGAHLVNFMGTDTMAALMMLKEFYGESCGGFSIPASEHSTMTSWGKEREVDAMRNMLAQYPTGLVACVSDSYDIYKACTDYWGTELKSEIMNRNGCLVVRPDSGELPKIVLDVLEKLESKFGHERTSTGHKLLPKNIRVIQGDGVDIKSLEVILKAMAEGGWAADNLAFGSGGALLQKMHRDTQKCAFKCSYALINGNDVDVVKDPITDPGKKSKKGRLTLEFKNNEWTTVTEGKGQAADDHLVEVFRDGRLLVDDSMAVIRKRATLEAVPPNVVNKSFGVTGDIFNNIVMLTDSYKVTHHLQYPPGTERIYSYFECRGGQFPEVCFFGLQYYLKKYMVGPVVTPDAIDAAEEYFKMHFSHPVYGYDSKLFNRGSWEYILKEHNGHLPVSIKAVPEGTVLPYKNALFTMENTDPKCYWLTNYLETLLVQVWYATTVCTQSREMKKIIMKFMKDTGCESCFETAGHMFKMHDFGFRGVSSVESAAIGGGGHLVNFFGTDTMASLMMLKEFYGCECAGYSIPASEHSTMTSWGREGECDAMRNMLEKYPTGLVACVSDSYDIYKACTDYWGGELKAQIEKRDGTLVVRPDSGELPQIVLDVLEKLESKFGSTETHTGHRKLPDCIRVIQGDGVDINSLEVVLQAMKDNNWAADNLAFGSGGALLQKMHRDTQKCAFKCSHAIINGREVDVVKDPITDPGKKSKKGRLTLECEVGEWTTTTEGRGDPAKDRLVEVFRDGKLLVDDSLEVIRKRAEVPLPA
jgi:nicotinamide phosphoribosyltransferase